MEEELLTVRETAEILRVDDTTVRRWIKHGILAAIELPHKRGRTQYRIRRATVQSLLSPTKTAKEHQIL